MSKKLNKSSIIIFVICAVILTGSIVGHNWTIASPGPSTSEQKHESEYDLNIGLIKEAGIKLNLIPAVVEALQKSLPQEGIKLMDITYDKPKDIPYDKPKVTIQGISDSGEIVSLFFYNLNQKEVVKGVGLTEFERVTIEGDTKISFQLYAIH